MSDLTAFRDHARRMAEAEHKPECPSLRKNWPPWSEWIPDFNEAGEIYRMVWAGPRPAPPTCEGCVSDADRVLWGLLGDETDRYLARDPDAEPEPEPVSADEVPLF